MTQQETPVRYSARVRRVLCAALAGLVLIVGAVSANAAVCDVCETCNRFFYVRKCGETNAGECNDANAGTSPQTAWASLQHAADYLNDRGSPGDAIIVGPGVYEEGDIDFRRDGFNEGGIYLPLSFLGDSTGTCTGDTPGPVVVNAGGDCNLGIACDTGFLVFGASNVVVSGFEILNARDAGVQIRPGPAGRVSTGAVVANNVIHDNGDDCSPVEPGCPNGRGVAILASNDVLVFNNLIHHNAATGVSVGDGFLTPEAVRGSPRVRIINNTIYRHQVGVTIGTGGTGTGLPSVSPAGWVINNIIAEHERAGIDVNSASTCEYVGAFNLVTGRDEGVEGAQYLDITPRDRSDIHVSPRFTAAEDDNFALDRISPAINYGSGPATMFGLDQATAREDGEPDTERVDLGYHRGSFAFPILTALPVDLQILYVRAGGRDARDGLSPEDAVGTITRAVELARANTRIVVGPGTYNEVVKFDARSYGPAGPVEFSADAAGAHTGDPSGHVLVNARGQDDAFNIINHCSTIVDGFAVTGGNDNGIGIKRSSGSIVRNNVAFSNVRRGITVVDSDEVEIVNNLAYANGDLGAGIGGGIQIGGDLGSHDTVIENNTLYGNGGAGILIGTGGVKSTGTQVRYNIIANNGKIGLQLDNNVNAGISAEGLCAEFNINFDSNPAERYGPILNDNCALCMESMTGENSCSQAMCQPRPEGQCNLAPPGDLALPPEFAQPLEGWNGCLGGRYFWDDDFRLAQSAAGQSLTSPAVDFPPIQSMVAGLSDRTTRSDNIVDAGRLDAGFHYLPMTYDVLPGLVGDCDASGCVTVNELVRGVTIAMGNAALGLCPGFDRNGNGQVSIDELVLAVNDAFCCPG